MKKTRTALTIWLIAVLVVIVPFPISSYSNAKITTRMERDMQLNDFIKYVKNGEIRQANGDGGDSAHRTGAFWTLISLLGLNKDTVKNQTTLDYDSSMSAFEVKPGTYRRTSEAGYWGSNPNNFSRDQWNVLQLAFAANNDKTRLKQAMLALVKRGLFHQNIHVGTDAPTTFPYGYKIPDLPHPTHFSVFIRGMDLWFLAPFLYLIDLTLFADLYLRKDSGDIDAMLSLHIMYANSKYGNFITRYVAKRYSKTDAILRLFRNFEEGPERNGIKPLGDLYTLALIQLVHGGR